MAKVAKVTNNGESEGSINLLQNLKSKLEKAVKGAHVSIMAQSNLADRSEFISTPSYDLNRILSGDMRKGIPKKTWVLFVAPEHAGKSSFMALLAAEGKKKFKSQVVVIDTEGGWDKKFVERWGLDANEILYIYTPWIDEIMVILSNLLDDESAQNMIIILDSIGGIEKKKLKEDALKGDPKADQGTLQKELKRMYKLLANIVKKKDSVALTAGHYYGNPSGYGDADQIGGGKYLRLAVDTTVAFKKSKLYDNNKNVIGNKLTATTMKNRIYPPFNEASIEINFKEGINKYAGLLDIAVEGNIISNSGFSYCYVNGDGKEIKAVGEKQAYNKIFANYGEEIVDKINDYIKESGFSTMNQELKAQVDLMEEQIAACESGLQKDEDLL